MLAWDVIVLNGYLLLNIGISAYVIYCHYNGCEPRLRRYFPFVVLAIFWAISIHTVTAFLYSANSGRPFWHNPLLAPRFIASAFCSGPALMVIGLQVIRRVSGYPLQQLGGEWVQGVKTAWVIYMAATQMVILAVAGPRLWGITLAIATLIAIPVVYLGAAVSFLLLLAGWGSGTSQDAFSAHYVTLCLTMLTVIPLALNIVAAIPFAAIEQALLKSDRGVSKSQKMLLMFLRVFNHIVFFVIPSTMEVVREEGRLARRASRRSPDHPKAGRLSGLINDLTQIGIEGICASIQYIPIWALEISRLPGKERRPR